MGNLPVDGQSESSGTNIGAYIRANVIPEGMSVKGAAELLGVGRPALSNLLNGHAALSPDMATRIERAFGTSAHVLMDMQAAYHTRLAQQKGVAASTRSYIPPFMQFKANDIEGWASAINARARFAVFLRTLINSTALNIKKVDFPGNDDAQRPGWDGFLETEDGMPWVPAGTSGWEFGTNEDSKRKADKDYKKSISQTAAAERAEITFVFVTPRRWAGKLAWKKERQAEKNWKDVLVFDSSDLEQWLEQSIPGQAWLACEMGVPAKGLMSLDECWKRWVADTDPPLPATLFDTVVEPARAIAGRKFDAFEPLIITSDSTAEALGFLHCLFSTKDSDLSRYRDQVVVFTEPGMLSQLVGKTSNFIAVITSRDVEKAYAPYAKELRSIIVYPRNATSGEVDIALEPLISESFRKGMESTRFNRDQIDMLGHESGRSLTVLRRRLSKLEAVRTPPWASDAVVARTLSGILFAGAWDSNNESDQVILSLLADGMPYEQLENKFADLLLLDDSPVWSIGRMRGLVSKIDVLFAINRRLVWGDIKRFISIAELVLSEDDPSLDLPAEQQWAAGMYGKTRQISSVLRRGIGETLVLLAVHGESLFRERLGGDVETEIGNLVKSLLCPLATRKLEAHSDDLPLYAEASPDIFLRILEDDLQSPKPQTLGLMRPVDSGIFGRNPRTGLLWALESIAWSPRYLMQVVRILAELAGPVINDNWVNKPVESLSAIFRCWMPQTSAPVEARIAALEYLVREYPKIAWQLCIEQFDGVSKIGSYSYKPRWRTEAQGAGEPVNPQERNVFALKALELAVNWKSHDADTLGDLVSFIGYLPIEFHDRIWALIESWNQTAEDKQKALLRERIRTSPFLCWAKMNGLKLPKLYARAGKTYQLLEPKDVIARNQWLFKNQWIEQSWDEMRPEESEYEARAGRIHALRRDALVAVKRERGLDGILDLAASGECGNVIGSLLSSIVANTTDLLFISKDILAEKRLDDSNVRQSIISGLLQGLVRGGRASVISLILNDSDDRGNEFLLTLAPFCKALWDIVATLKDSMQEKYWKAIKPHPILGGERKFAQHAINCLLDVDRPRAAFVCIQYDLEAVAPKLLFRIMSAVASRPNESDGALQLDSYRLIQAFKILTDSREIPVDQMAGLEFQYIDAFSLSDAPIPNLEQHIETYPELFVQAVAMVYRRSDGGEDPEELRAPNEEAQSIRARAAYHLLRKLSVIPGHDEQGKLSPGRIETWIQRVRVLATELSRRDICDVCLGELFSKAPTGQDGIWPCLPVRDVIEHIANDKFSSGLQTGLYNSHGAHFRGEGGDDERILAERYDNWSSKLEFSHPVVSTILRQMAKSYRHDAVREDERAGVRRRFLDYSF